MLGKDRARNWLLTLNNPDKSLEEIHVTSGATYTCGQLEKGEEGTTHLQFFQNFVQPKSLALYKKLDKRIHAEPVLINNGAHSYCLKEDTRIDGPWEYGKKPVQRNNKTDWEEVKLNAKRNRLDEVPADVYVRYYGALKKIAKDNLQYMDKDELRGV